MDRTEIQKCLVIPIDLQIKSKAYSGYCVDHHLAHLYSGAAISDKREFLVVSIDGAGSKPTNLLPLTYAGLSGHFVENSLQSVEALHFGGGIIYSIGAKIAGMSEGKLMGLAPYINTKSIQLSGIKEAIAAIDQKFYDKNEIISQLNVLIDKNSHFFKVRRLDDGTKRELPPMQAIAVAALTQALYEESHLNLVRSITAKFPDIPVIFTGGCTLNCPANTIAHKLIKNVTFDPSMTKAWQQVQHYVLTTYSFQLPKRYTPTTKD